MNLTFKIFIIIALASPLFGNGQCDSLRKALDKDGNSIVFGEPENWPKFPGGDEARNAYLKEHLKLPAKWPPDSITGKVYVNFIVDEKGNIKCPRILRGLNPVVDSIVITAIIKMPRWIPGTERGLPVCRDFSLPIKFGSEYQEKNSLRR